LREMQVKAVDPRIPAAVTGRDLAAVSSQERVVINVIIVGREVLGRGLRADGAPLREDRIVEAGRNIDQVVTELAVAVGIAVIQHAVRMAGSAFVNRAHGRFPAFRPNKGLGDDGEETVAQLEVGSTKNVYVRIPGNRVKPEVR